MDEAKIKRWAREALFKNKEMRILIGTNALISRPTFLSLKQLSIHMHILGSSGMGKTFLLEHLARALIALKKGICVIDPHGALYQRLLKYVVRKRLERKTILFDPNDRDWAVGLNYLEYDQKNFSPTSHASLVMRGISRVFGDENQEAKPQLSRWERDTLIPLVQTGQTLVEIPLFLALPDGKVRKRLLEKTKNPYLELEWESFEAGTKQDKSTWSTPVLNRANKFILGDNIRRIVGQRKSTINFREAMDEGKIILVNLACTHLSQEEQRMLGVMIVDKVVQAAMSRADIPEEKRRPFYFIIDEFGEFVCEDIARALQALRKFKVSMILAHQELEQLREDSKRVYSAVMANPTVRVVFKTSREDGEKMALEMFTGKIRDDVIKRVIRQTKYEPVETTREIVTDSQTITESYSETEGSSFGSGEGESKAEVYAVGKGPLGLADELVTVIKNTSESTFSSESRSTTEGYSESFGHSVSKVPFYEYHPYKEVTSIEDYSIQGIIEKFIAWIVNQTPRHAQLKIGTSPPIPIVTPEVKEVKVRKIDIQRFKEYVYSRYAKRVEEVDREIEERRKQLLKEETLEEPTNFRE